MTIKIITKGIGPKTIPLCGTCYTCRTVVECEQSDANFYSSSYGGDSGYCVVCPVCSASISLTQRLPDPPEPPAARTIKWPL